jgi:hypothetical protein
VLATVCILLSSCRSQQLSTQPSIEFTSIPQAGEGGPGKLSVIAGRVTGGSPGQRIVLLARSGVWWAQPYADRPFTRIQPDSTWSNLTHLGTEYAALLVGQRYRPSPTMASLPGRSADVIAVASVKGTGELRLAKSTKLQFSGYEWEARRFTSARGGKSNVYDPANAWVDTSGFLHLRISREGRDWSSGEVSLTRSLGYGSYIFVVRDTSHLEPAAVFSMLTWDDMAENENYREMDIEISRWGNPGSKNAQYVIQPYYVPANVVRFEIPSGPLAYSFRWQPGRVAFRTEKMPVLNPASHPIGEHVFTSGIPSANGAIVHVNLYVFQNARSSLQNGTEVVIEKFEYLP